MSQSRITQEDLAWWWEFAATRAWTFARTYAATAPHDYIVAGRSPGVTQEDIVRAARVICTFGQPGKYYAVTKIYLTSPDGVHRWWTEDRHFTDATLVNRGPTSALYGIQNAPATATSAPSSFDDMATTWDADHSPADGEATHVQQLLAEFRSTFPPHVLDLGAGTGRTLDLNVVSPDRYAAVDSSRSMLNVLVRKYPKVAAVYPADVRDLLAGGTFTPGQFDWVVLDSTVELTNDQLRDTASLARHAVLHVDGEKWDVEPASSGS